jgi:hypothetical protein
MSYRDRVRKTVTLPSGATVTVRARTRLEDILIGQPPGWFKRHKPDTETTPEQDAAFAEYIGRVERILLTSCIVGQLVDGNDAFDVVDKAPKDTGLDEISWAELTRADSEAILGAINEVSGLTKAGQEARNTFPVSKEGTQ